MSDGQKRRLVDRLVDPAFLEGLDQRSTEELRAMREESREGETELSFERRLCQARIDILEAELDRRAGKTEGDLVSRLPQILGQAGAKGDLPLPNRAPQAGVPRNADIPRRRVEDVVGERTLARLPDLPDEEVEAIVESLKKHEATTSSKRKQVQEVMDRVQAEIVRRYSSGEEDPAAVESSG